MPNYIPATVHNPPQESPHIPDLLAPGSPLDSLSPDYRQEAVRWVQFHSGNALIPGIHVDFTNDAIRKYLEYRAKSSKCISQILCKIKKMGQVCGFILHTSKYQATTIVAVPDNPRCKTTGEETKAQRGSRWREKRSAGDGQFPPTISPSPCCYKPLGSAPKRISKDYTPHIESSSQSTLFLTSAAYDSVCSTSPPHSDETCSIQGSKQLF